MVKIMAEVSNVYTSLDKELQKYISTQKVQ